MSGAAARTGNFEKYRQLIMYKIEKMGSLL